MISAPPLLLQCACLVSA